MPAPSADTLIDRLDEQGNPIGLVERGKALAEGANFRVAHVLLEDPAGRVLLQRLGREHPRNPLKLGSSTAGYLYPFENYEQGASRRMLEEIGVLTALHPIGVFRMPDVKSTKFIGLFAGTSPTAPAVQDRGHVEAVIAMTPSDIDQLLRKDPDAFTETFRFLWPIYRARRR